MSTDDFEGCQPYADAAKRSGTTLAEALKRYTGAEQFLNAAPISGLLWLAEYHNVSMADLVSAAMERAEETQ